MYARCSSTDLALFRFLKDIKTAILAADVIVNEWGFQDYRLNIYGDMDKAPAYSVECKEILASKCLRDHVFLKGMGNPATALKEAVSSDPTLTSSMIVDLTLGCGSGSSSIRPYPRGFPWPWAKQHLRACPSCAQTSEHRSVS